MLSRRRFELLAAALGVLMRLLFVVRFPLVSGDSFVYADLARNLLHQHVLGLTENGVAVPTLIRLPGYPAFVAGIFALAGDNAFRAVMLAQLVVDMLSCVAIAALAAELVSGERRERVWRAAFLLACVCPFTANYVALPLTETLAIATTAGALLYGVRACRAGGLKNAVLCASALGGGVLLRPDNGILSVAIVGWILWVAARERRIALFRHAAVIVAIVAAPLALWTARNHRVFGVWQPLAPRYANAPDEFVPRGFNRWVKTWIVDYVSVGEIYWRIDSSDDPPDPERLPARAFDDAAERERTFDLFARVTDEGAVTPALDPEFAALAAERIRRHPLRYYVTLPMVRVAGMWLRPRIEMLPLEQRWWQFDDPQESVIAVALGAINLGFVLCAVCGAWRLRWSSAAWMTLAFVGVRSAFLGTLENPEPRYVLQCFPVVLAFASVALAAVSEQRHKRSE